MGARRNAVQKPPPGFPSQARQHRERAFGAPVRYVDGGDYASAKGKGTKDRLRILIDLDAARTSSIGELAGLLDSHGITLTLRGGSVTFIDRATGRKFRGSRLGEAYSLDAIGARLMDCGSMLHLTFNNKLVAAVNDRTISVWLPGTKRRRKVNLPVGMLRRDGSTWHLLMPETFTGMVMDRANRYAERFNAATLADAFGGPGQQLEPLASGVRTAVDPACVEPDAGPLLPGPGQKARRAEDHGGRLERRVPHPTRGGRRPCARYGWPSSTRCVGIRSRSSGWRPPSATRTPSRNPW